MDRLMVSKDFFESDVEYDYSVRKNSEWYQVLMEG